MLTRLRARNRDERGATIILFSLLLVSLLGMSGLVLDVALVRYDRQRNKSVADSAVAAGMRALEVPGTGIPAPFRGACAALDFVRANHPDLGAVTGTWTFANNASVGVDPCHPTNTASIALRRRACLPSFVPGYENTWAVFDGNPVNGVDVEIHSGYDVNDTSGGGYGDEAYHSDDGAADQGGCDNLAVIIRETERAGLGRVVHGGDLTSRVRSVGRARFGVRSDHIIALLLLERRDCASLDVNGNSGAFVEVLAEGSRQGIVHSDSAGLNNCSSDNNVLNVNPAGPPARIIARQTASGTPGTVSVYALSGLPGTHPENASDPWPGSVYAEGQPGSPPGGPTAGEQLGRGSVDRRYLEQMRLLRQDAAARTAWTPPALAPGFVDVGCPNNGDIPHRYVFVNCTSASGFSPNGVVRFTAADSEIVVNNKITITGGASRLVIRDPRKVFVLGNGGTGVSVGSDNGFSVNAGLRPDGTEYPTCDARYAAGQTTKKVEFVIMNGTLSASGNGGVRMCQTMLYLAGGTGLPDGIGDAPSNNSSNGTLSITGGGGVDWTAPNQLPNTPTITELNDPAYRFEDLALWTEASDGSSIGGTGNITMHGVFFLPNADAFNIGGNGNQEIGENAQFIVRKLRVSGNSYLRMKPNANDAIPYPFFEGSTLVR